MKIEVKWYFPKNFEIDIFLYPGQNVLVTLTVCTLWKLRNLCTATVFRKNSVKITFHQRT